MPTVTEATDRLHEVFLEHYDREIYGVPEACTEVNDASRALVAAMHAEYGQAWILQVNGYNLDNWQPLTPWQPGQPCYNFCGSWVVPCFDVELDLLLRERAAAPYTGTKDDGHRIDAIWARAEAIGGQLLMWS